jgi:IclR family transcriptional regulator, KDG regulon repressor
VFHGFAVYAKDSRLVMTLPFNQPYKTLQDLARILSLFKHPLNEEIGVSDISRAVGIQPSKASRMLRTLQSSGFFERNPATGKFRLGVEFFDLGMLYLQHLPLRKIIRPHVYELAKKGKATAVWAILHGYSVSIIDRLGNFDADMPTHRMQQNLPIHCTSVGKCLLAYLPEGERKKILDATQLRTLTKATIAEQGLLELECKKIRAQGYATDREETVPKFNGIAAPIRDSQGVVVATIGLHGYEWEIKPKALFGLTGYVKEKARFISQQLGFPGIEIPG